jgi:hypothetical protein
LDAVEQQRQKLHRHSGALAAQAESLEGLAAGEVPNTTSAAIFRDALKSALLRMTVEMWRHQILSICDKCGLNRTKVS